MENSKTQFSRVIYILGKLSLCLIAFFAEFSKSQVVSFGKCPRANGIPDFDTRAYSGLWYEVEKYWFVFEATTSCARVTYEDSYSRDGSFAVTILQYDNLTGKTFNNPGLTRFASKDGTGDFVLDIQITQSPIPFTVKFPYLVLGTDYETFTIKWACQQIGPFNIQNLWILSREKIIPEKSRKQVYRILGSLGISTANLRQSNTNQCS